MNRIQNIDGISEWLVEFKKDFITYLNNKKELSDFINNESAGREIEIVLSDERNSVKSENGEIHIFVKAKAYKKDGNEIIESYGPYTSARPKTYKQGDFLEKYNQIIEYHLKADNKSFKCILG